jgi:urea transport system substrate-binding protein
LPIFEQKNHILFYPVQYEGEECSKNIFYTGAAPNQQISPAVEWLAKTFPGNDFFLIGSDYVFPRIANEIIKNQVKDSLGKKSMQMYIPLGGTEVEPVFKEILSFLPTGGIIFNTLNGDTNVSFFKRYKELGLTPDKYPTLSVSISEVEIADIGKDLLLGHFASWNYFMTVDNEANKKFIASFHKKYGKDRLINDPMECAYNSVHLWAKAVKSAGSTDLSKVRLAAMGQNFEAPQGKVSLDSNHHLSKWIRIGKVNSQGLFDIVYSSNGPVRAEPYSPYYPLFAHLKCDWTGIG